MQITTNLIMLIAVFMFFLFLWAVARPVNDYFNICSTPIMYPKSSKHSFNFGSLVL